MGNLTIVENLPLIFSLKHKKIIIKILFSITDLLIEQ